MSHNFIWPISRVHLTLYVHHLHLSNHAPYISQMHEQFVRLFFFYMHNRIDKKNPPPVGNRGQCRLKSSRLVLGRTLLVSNQSAAANGGEHEYRGKKGYNKFFFKRMTPFSSHDIHSNITNKISNRMAGILLSVSYSSFSENSYCCCCCCQARNDLHRRRCSNHLACTITKKRVSYSRGKADSALDDCERLDILCDRRAVTGLRAFAGLCPRRRGGTEATVASLLFVSQGQRIDDGRERRADKSFAGGCDGDGGLFETLVAEDGVDRCLGSCCAGERREDSEGCNECGGE